MEQQADYFLHTERLGFRSWHEDDLPLAFDLWGDPNVTRFIDERDRLREADVKERLDHELDLEREHGVQYWPIFLRQTGTHVGCCGLRPYDLPNRIYELGVHIISSYWRRGLAEEAATAVMGYAFDVLGAQALFAGHHPHNVGSRRLLVKLGFRYTHDELYPPTGLQHPSYRLRRT